MICISPGPGRSSWFKTHGEMKLGRLEALLRMVTTGWAAQGGWHRVGSTEESSESYPGRLLEAYRRPWKSRNWNRIWPISSLFSVFLEIFVNCIIFATSKKKALNNMLSVEAGRSGGRLAELCASVSPCVKRGSKFFLQGRPGGSLRTTVLPLHRPGG